MIKKHSEKDFPIVSLKNDSAKQRWELFHRAIAHAKASNHESLSESDTSQAATERHVPVLSVVR